MDGGRGNCSLVWHILGLSLPPVEEWATVLFKSKKDKRKLSIFTSGMFVINQNCLSLKDSQRKVAGIRVNTSNLISFNGNCICFVSVYVVCLYVLAWTLLWSSELLLNRWCQNDVKLHHVPKNILENQLKIGKWNEKLTKDKKTHVLVIKNNLEKWLLWLTGTNPRQVDTSQSLVTQCR